MTFVERPAANRDSLSVFEANLEYIVGPYSGEQWPTAFRFSRENGKLLIGRHLLVQVFAIL